MIESSVITGYVRVCRLNSGEESSLTNLKKEKVLALELNSHLISNLIYFKLIVYEARSNFSLYNGAGLDSI